MILVIGEILFDVFPNYRRLGGAPFNFAYHLKKFGFNVRFVSKIGTDDAGKEILHKLELAELLEQLRALSNGYAIHSASAAARSSDPCRRRG